MSKAFERVAEFNLTDNTHRVYDIDRFGREVQPPMAWKASTTKGDTGRSHSELWEDAVFLVGNYRADSRITLGNVIQVRRYL